MNHQLKKMGFTEESIAADEIETLIENVLEESIFEMGLRSDVAKRLRHELIEARSGEYEIQL